MKAKLSIIALFISLFSTITLIGQTRESMDIIFPTSGNCYTCKLRIEDAVNTIVGVEFVNWVNSDAITEVIYDGSKTDAFQIMHTIANVGHDTEWYPAPDSAYNLLIGTCCEYERVMDYTNVQEGYLSLMDIWVTPLTEVRLWDEVDISIFPTIGNGLFYINIGNFQHQTQIGASVYSIAGQRVYTQNLTTGNENQIDLSSLNSGQYFLVVLTGKTVISKSKLIKL
ncbi:MAG: hypothetical protein CVT99_15385 [Bacteroidetes bacterium HGW-Bacteroidetes-16]|jgi:hypothetical protein|nr:MAG: hypothetical protein CVT99_15385 [Bacteroidetes bacterium HGW-Bacteroidetes-16]